MIKIGEYLVTSNSYSTRQNASLCVKLNGMIMCKMRFTESLYDPLRHIQTNPGSPYRKEFVERLEAAGCSQEDIKSLLVPVPSKYHLEKMKKEQNG